MNYFIFENKKKKNVSVNRPLIDFPSFYLTYLTYISLYFSARYKLALKG